MTQNPTTYCSKCHTTRPPLLSARTYSCVMCGKSRSVEEFREELAGLRAAAARMERYGMAPPAVSTPPAPTVQAPAPPTPAAKAPPAKAAPAMKPQPAAKAEPAPKPEPKKAPAKTKTAAAPKAKASGAESHDCAWKDCENQARSNSKYCSRSCSNKNARWRHKHRGADAA